MSDLQNRVKRLEMNRPGPESPVWAEILDDGGAVLRFADGSRVQVQADEIPFGVKVYKGFSPDVWRMTNEQPRETN